MDPRRIEKGQYLRRISIKLDLYLYQEEDASINTASLSILDEIETPKFLELLDQALSIVNAELEKSPSKALEAIETRLTFRKQFLEIVAGIGMPPKKRHHALENCQSLLVKIVESMELGKPSAGAFSTRIQRRLSISVPPRPMVSIDPKEAAKGMKSILDNLLEMDDIQEYRAPHELLVCSLDVTLTIRISLIILLLESL